MKHEHGQAAQALSHRDVLTPVTLALIRSIAHTGSFAAAAREAGLVPSALTYRIRQLEDALDVLLFDRSSRQAKLTAAGEELLREGERLLNDVDAVAHRVKRVATGWEAELTIAIDSVMNRATVLDLCAQFYELKPPTRLRLISETLSGTLAALTQGRADLALGVVFDDQTHAGIQREALGELEFVFAMAPHHPLAALPEPLSDTLIRQHRAVAAADSNLSGRRLTIGLLQGQDVLTVPDMDAKLAAQARGLGVGFVPECMASSYFAQGTLVARAVERQRARIVSHYAWRADKHRQLGRALQWWLRQLEEPVTRQALLGGVGRGHGMGI